MCAYLCGTGINTTRLTIMSLKTKTILVLTTLISIRNNCTRLKRQKKQNSNAQIIVINNRLNWSQSQPPCTKHCPEYATGDINMQQAKNVSYSSRTTVPTINSCQTQNKMAERFRSEPLVSASPLVLCCRKAELRTPWLY